jgi:hypothetical protein
LRLAVFVLRLCAAYLMVWLNAARGILGGQ